MIKNKYLHLITAALAATIFASEATAATFSFTAERAPNIMPVGDAGPATAFANSADEAFVSGTFSFDPNAALLETLVVGGDSSAVFYRNAGPASITLNGPTGTQFLAGVSAFPPVASGKVPSVLIQDIDVGDTTGGGADLFSINVTNVIDDFILTLSDQSNSVFSRQGLPTKPDLADFSSTRLFVFPEDPTQNAFLAYRFTSIAAVPLPASAVLPLAGVAGLGAFARPSKQS